MGKKYTTSPISKIIDHSVPMGLAGQFSTPFPHQAM